MQNFITSSIKNAKDYLKSQIYSTTAQSVKLVENQQKIIYFTAFDLEPEEMEKTYCFVKSIKENLFSGILQVTKYTVKEIVSIPAAQTEYQKTLTLFSTCFLHYYTKFSYTKCPTFNDFFTSDLMDLCKKFGITIVHSNQFKVYCYSFYYQMIKELNQLEYETLVKINGFGLDVNNNFSSQIKEVVDKKIIQAVVSAKERIIDMVYSFGKKQDEPPVQAPHPSELSNIKNNLYEIYATSNEEKPETNENSSTDDMSVSTDASSQFFSKRVLSEMSKCTTDTEAKEIIDIITKTIDMSFFDNIDDSKYDIESINPFLCTLIQLKSGELLNGYTDASSDYICRFIFIAKKLYNKAVEIYFTLYNLVGTETSTFEHMIRLKIGLNKSNDDWVKCILYYFKMLTNELKSQKGEIDSLKEVENKMRKEWSETVVNKFENLTTFCALN